MRNIEFVYAPGNVKLNMRNFEKFWHYSEINKLTRFLDEITVFCKTMKMFSFGTELF